MFDAFSVSSTAAAMLDGKPALALAGSLVWGLGSALLSPCHLGIIPLMGGHGAGISPLGAGDRHSGRDILRFCLGYFCSIPLLGALIALLGHSLGLGGHFWTIPVGLLLLWLAWDMGRGHACAHVALVLGRMQRWLGISAQSGIYALGLGYGLLAGGCTVGFLAPMLLVALPRGFGFCLLLAFCFGLGHCLPMLVVGLSAAMAGKLMAGHSHDHPCDEEHHRHDHLPDPHTREALFRKLLAMVLGIMGLLFVAHPFLE